jgi:hypothetical protein
MADPNFEDVLSMKPSQIEKPKPRPIGTYLGGIQKYELRDVDTKNGTRKIIDFSVKLMAPRQVDDADALAQQGDISDWFPLTYGIFYEKPEGRYNLKNFLSEVCGIDPGEGRNEKSLSEMIAASPGSQVLATLRHEPYTDRNTGQPEIATRIASVAKA